MGEDKSNIQLVKDIVESINTMAALLFEIKAGTPLGKTLKTLFNLCRRDGKDSAGGVINLTGISFRNLAGMMDITEPELKESLDYLQQNGKIYYRPASGRKSRNQLS